MLRDTCLFSIPIKQGDDYHKSQDNDYSKYKKEILIQKAVNGSGELGKFCLHRCLQYNIAITCHVFLIAPVLNSFL